MESSALSRRPLMMDDDDAEVQLREAKADLEKQWEEAFKAAAGHAESLRKCGLERGTADAASLPRLNALAQDCLGSLRKLQSRFDLVACQFPSVEGKDACLKILEGWKTEYQMLHATVREANLQAKSNILKAAKSERDLLLGGGEESTNLRRNLQTQKGMSAAAESVTDSLRRTRQMMLQELERGHGTLATLDESNTTLRKADSEYKAQRYLLNAARGLLSILKRHDIIDRIILVAGFLLFTVVVMYIFNQRVGLFKMQRKEHTFYGGHNPQASTPTVSTNVPPSKQGMDMSLQHLPNVKLEEGSTLHCEDLEACTPRDYFKEVNPSSAVPVDRSEL